MPATDPAPKKKLSLRSKTARASLAVRNAPYWQPLEKGRALGYRKGKLGGVWSARFYDPEAQPPMVSKALGSADDGSEADGKMVLSYEQALDAAREWFKVAYHDATGDRVQTGAYTVADAIQAYVEDRKRNGAKTADRLLGDLGRHVLPHLGSVELGKLTRKRIQDWLEVVAASPTFHAGKEGSAPQTPDEVRARRESANRVWKSFRAALNLAHRDRRVSTDAGWKDVKAFKGTKQARVRFLSINEQQRLVNAAGSEDFRRLIQAGLFTGAREGELLRLKAQDVSLDVNRPSIFIETSKSGKARYVDLSPEAAVFFAECVAGLKPGDLVYTRTSYTRRKAEGAGQWTRPELCRKMQAVCSDAELDPMVFHELRHTCASTWINAGMSLYHVAQQLGHRDTRMVEEHYGHLSQSAKADSMRRLAPELGIHVPSGVQDLSLARRA